MDKSETYKAIASRLGMAAKFELTWGTVKARYEELRRKPGGERGDIGWLRDIRDMMNDPSSTPEQVMKEMDHLVEARGFARPGAKAVMAMTVAQAEQIINTIDERKASQTSWNPAMDHLTKQRDFAQRLIVAHRQSDTANIKRYSALLEKAGWARPGAKSRHAIREGDKVSAADDAVSRKIRKLMDEGKPQKQAVAIALDLERRGEL